MRIIPLLSRKHADAKSKINYFLTICSSIAVGRAVSSPQSYRVFMFQFKRRFHPSTQLPVYFCFMFVSAARNISVWRTRPRSDIASPILLVLLVGLVARLHRIYFMVYVQRWNTRALLQCGAFESGVESKTTWAIPAVCIHYIYIASNKLRKI